MKKTLLLLTAFAACSLFAIDQARIDLNGTKDGVTLTKVKSNANIANGSWLAEDKRNQLMVASLAPAANGEWQTMEVVFTADKPGKVNIEVAGQWGKTPEERLFYIYKSVAIEPNASQNPEFTKNQDGKANGWGVSNKAELVDGGVKVNHDNRAYQTITVEPGKEYTVKATFKKAE